MFLVCSPIGSPSLFSLQSSSAQHSFLLAETQNEPAEFIQRFIAHITLARVYVYANFYLHIQNVCLLLPANMFNFCMLWLSMQIPFFQHQLSPLPQSIFPFPKTFNFRPCVMLLSQKAINIATTPYTNAFAHSTDSVDSVLTLFPFLSLQLPPPSFAQTWLSLTPSRRRSSTTSSAALFLTGLTHGHLSAPFAKETTPPKAAFNRTHVRDYRICVRDRVQKHLTWTGRNKILQRKGDKTTAWVYLLNIYNQRPFS